MYVIFDMTIEFRCLGWHLPYFGYGIKKSRYAVDVLELIFFSLLSVISVLNGKRQNCDNNANF